VIVYASCAHDLEDLGDHVTEEKIRVTIGVITLLVIVVWAATSGLDYLDHAGLDDHMVQSTIEFAGDWMQGETRSCISFPLTTEAASVLKKEPGSVTSAITCDSGKAHDVKIEFWGRTVQPRKTDGSSWKCTRNEMTVLTAAPFTCKQE
jgi:hypothetical protein